MKGTKKLLFIAPDYYGFNEVVVEGFTNYSGFEVQHIVSNEKYIYGNLWEKIENFISKTFFKINKKHEKSVESLSKKFFNLHQFDYIIINRHDLLSENQLKVLKTKTSNLFGVFWDSIDKIPNQESNINLFDKIFSFDRFDCEEHNFSKISNFYFVKQAESKNLKFTVSYLGTYDKRIDAVVDFFNYFQEMKISSIGKIYIYISELKGVKEILPSSVQFIHKIVPFRKSYEFYNQSKMILDLAHENQKGLSFRPFEAIGLKKKLITNNPEILKYDFYNHNNIFLVQNSKDINIPADFFTSDYEELDPEISEKYYIKNWVQNLLNVE